MCRMTTLQRAFKTVQLVSILTLIASQWMGYTAGLESAGNGLWRVALIAVVASSVAVAASTSSGPGHRLLVGVGLAAATGMIAVHFAVFVLRQQFDFFGTWQFPYLETWRVLTVIGMVCAIVLTVRMRTGRERQPQRVLRQNVTQP